jgi:hypothetical protein
LRILNARSGKEWLNYHTDNQFTEVGKKMKDKILRCCNVDSVIMVAAAAWFVSVIALMLG